MEISERDAAVLHALVSRGVYTLRDIWTLTPGASVGPRTIRAQLGRLADGLLVRIQTPADRVRARSQFPGLIGTYFYATNRGENALAAWIDAHGREPEWPPPRRVWMLFWGGASFRQPDHVEADQHPSLRAAEAAFWRASKDPLVESCSALLYYAEPAALRDPYPDFQLTIGPRGGVRRTRC